MSEINWTAERSAWLIALAKDKHARGIPLAIAVVLANKYHNMKTGEAWPSIGTLVDDIGVNRRSVRRALDWLVSNGWLLRDKSGKKPTNVYRLAHGGVHTPREGAYTPPGRGCTSHEGGGVHTPRTLERLTLEFEPESVRADARPPQEKILKNLSEQEAREGEASCERRRKSPLPENWVCGEPELEVAQEVTDWDEMHTLEEFAKFLDWYRANKPYSYDWIASWRNWCRRGAGRRGAGQSKQQKVVVALREWVVAQKKREGK